MVLSRTGNDLILTDGAAPVVVQNYFLSAQYRNVNVTFKDSVTWTAKQLQAMVAPSYAVETLKTPTPIDFGNVRVGASASETLSIMNSATPPAEGLDASIGSTTGAATGTGSFSLLQAGATDSTDIVVGINSSSAGAKTGSVTLNLASDGTGLDNNGITSLPSQTIQVSGTVYREASASAAPLPTNLQFRVGDTAHENLAITNTAVNDGYSENLIANVVGTSGAVTASGTTGDIAAQAMNNTSVGIDISTATAGVVSGNVTLDLASDGTGVDGLGTIGIGQQTVAVDATVYREATASVAPLPANLVFRVGDTAMETLTVTNMATNDGYSENLIANVVGTSGAVTASGTTGDIAAQASSNALSVNISTATAGQVSGNVVLGMTSDGTGIDNLGAIGIGQQAVAVNAAVYREASASAAPLPSNLVFRVGDTATETLTVTNTAANDGYSENLIANVASTSGSVTASGTTGDIAAQTTSTAINIGISTATAGHVSGDVVLNLTSDGAGVDGLGTIGIGQQTVAVNATVYREATAWIAPLPSNLVFRVGDVATETLSIGNTAANDGYSENLIANVVGTTGGLTASGSTGDIAAQATSNGIQLNLSTATAGVVSGNLTLGLTSDGTGVDGLATIGIGQQTIGVNAKVYREATASVAPLPSNLIVHVGDVVTETLAVTNTAVNDGYSENLVASVTGASGALTATGTTGDIAAQTTNNGIHIGISTATAGVVSGNVTLGLASDGTGVDGLGSIGLGSQTVAMTATVDNYAKAALEEVSGGGAWSQNGNSYNLTLNEGPATAQNPVQALIDLGVMNAAQGLADVLNGSFVASSNAAFTLAGLDAFSGLAAGQADTVPTVAFKATGPGTYTETITLHSAGSNASGYSGALADETFTFTVNVGRTYNLTRKADTITGGLGNNVIVATNHTLNARDNIDGGSSGNNTLALQGGGTFDLQAPATLTDIQTITAQEGVHPDWDNGFANSYQTVYLRDGMNATVNVASAPVNPKDTDDIPGITIYGANNSATINLGNGNDTVTLGSAAETVNGGTGNNTFYVTASTIGATIHGGTGQNTLDITGGGSMVMGSNITGIATVNLGNTELCDWMYWGQTGYTLPPTIPPTW